MAALDIPRVISTNNGTTRLDFMATIDVPEISMNNDGSTEVPCKTLLVIQDGPFPDNASSFGGFGVNIYLIYLLI